MTQQRALDTRAGLVDAAATEFTQHGYAGGSVNRMLDVAACTKGAMYFHFASKRALAEAVLEAAEQAYSAVGQRWPTTGDVHPIVAIAHMVDAAADLYEHDLRVQAASRLTLEPEFVDRYSTRGWVDAVAGHAARLAESGCLVDGFTADRFARALVTILAGQRYLARVVPIGDTESISSRYSESLDVVLTAAVSQRSREWRMPAAVGDTDRHRSGPTAAEMTYAGR